MSSKAAPLLRELLEWRQTGADQGIGHRTQPNLDLPLGEQSHEAIGDTRAMGEDHVWAEQIEIARQIDVRRDRLQAERAGEVHLGRERWLGMTDHADVISPSACRSIHACRDTRSSATTPGREGDVRLP